MVHKHLIVGGMVLVCLYAAGAILYDRQSPEIGLRCAFDTQVQRIHEDYIVHPKPGDPSRPQVGDYLLRIGPKRIDTWSDYVRTVADLNDLSRFPRSEMVESLSPDLLERLTGSGAQLVRLADGTDLVLVELYRPVGKSGGDRLSAWCRIGPPPLAEAAPSLIWLCVKMGLLLIGAVVFWKRPNDAAARLFFLLCIATVGAFMGGYHWLRIAGSPPLVAGFMIGAVLLPAVSLHFYLVFPRRKPFLVRRPKLTLGLLYGLPGLFLLGMLATYATVLGAHRLAHDVEVVTRAYRLLLHEIYAYLVVAAALFLCCAISLVHSFRHTQAGTPERNQVKWILAGVLIACIPIGYTLFVAATDVDRLGQGGATWPMFIASLSMTLAYGISISRYGLMEVDQVLNWGIVYFALSSAAGLAYYGMVFLGTLLVGSQVESPFRQAAWVSSIALLLLIGLDLFRWRLRRGEGRRFHREKYQLDKTLRRMSQAVDQMVDPPTLGRRMLHALADVLGFERGAIYLPEENGAMLRLSASLGEPPPLPELGEDSTLLAALQQSPLVLRPEPGKAREPAHRQLELLGGEAALPLRHEGKLTALLLVGTPEVGRYGAEELQLLMAFGQIAAAALHGSRGHQTIERLNRELQAKVDKIAEQQRRILVLQSQLLRHEEPTDAQPPGSKLEIAGIVGSSTAMEQLLRTVRKVAGSPSAVVIRGESGTGKELLARALHENSARKKGPFVKVHCAALSPGLLESELFGHVKGAFTGAVRDKIGRFEMAHGGTLFLDEIGDITPEVQTKLLRVLQEMAFERVGSSEPIRVDVRLITATNQNLEKLIREGRFREDLFYRLNVITIRTPALRERRDDIYELALHFLKVYGRRTGKNLTHIEEDALEALKAHAWPGNVRELENVIERAVVLTEGSAISIQELPEEVLRAGDAWFDAEPANGNGFSSGGDSRSDLVLTEEEWAARRQQKERDRLMRALTAAAGNQAQAARALHMPRSTFISKLKKHGLL